MSPVQGVGEWAFKAGSTDTIRSYMWLNYRVEREPEPLDGEDEFSAVCVELDVSSSGRDWVEALNACRAAVIVTLNALEREGMLDDYLSARHLKVEMAGELPVALAEIAYPVQGESPDRFNEPVVERVAAGS